MTQCHTPKIFPTMNAVDQMFEMSKVYTISSGCKEYRIRKIVAKLESLKLKGINARVSSFKVIIDIVFNVVATLMSSTRISDFLTYLKMLCLISLLSLFYGNVLLMARDTHKRFFKTFGKIV